jgi:hypothetical protein
MDELHSNFPNDATTLTRLEPLFTSSPTRTTKPLPTDPAATAAPSTSSSTPDPEEK